MVEVALPVPIEQTYSYDVPRDLAQAVVPGVRVQVPFGRRSLIGVVVGPSDSVPDATVRPIEAVLDARPALTDELLQLTKWIADYYVCGWGEALRAALPPGGDVQPKREWHVRLCPEFRSASARQSLIEQLRGAKQIALISWLGEKHSEGAEWVRQAEATVESGAASTVLRVLEERAIVERRELDVMRVGSFGAQIEPSPRHTLHPSQRTALQEITTGLRSGSFVTFLLHGVTGSGKTEVYIEALKETLHQGRTGIVLVPEIALTPQTVGRFRAHFGDAVAVLHSRMSLGERYDAWRQLRDGHMRIAIGPRSAILAPLENIGLIIVDEEHEASYKQADPAPRYHARDVAVMRAHLNHAVCVLGSATPSLESWVNATEIGKYQLLEMPERVPVAVGVAQLPDVQIVDLVRERKRHMLDGVFSRPLLEAVQTRLSRSEQVILLQNRRGFAPVIECLDCGWTPECPDCSVSFTYHKVRRHLKCHYCGRTERMPARCASCGGSDLEQLGAGTQRVEEELQKHFPSARIARMDLDTTGRKSAHHEILSRFRNGEADVLLGTQMVAKGLDFPRVTLVGVVNADTGLLLPDFRADEQTFQLLTQVAGRAGRADLPGEVILQTRNADHAVVRLAAAHDYRGFVDAVLPERRAFRWPPYVRLVVIEFSGPDERKVREMAERWTARLRDEAPEFQVLDTVPALISRVKKRHRYRTIVKAPRGRSGDVQASLRAVMQALPKPSGTYRVSIDVDAVDTL